MGDCPVHMYADDVQLYTSTRKGNIEFCLHSINRDLDRIDRTVRLRPMDYALIPQSPNVLCFREPMFRLLYMDWILKETKLTLSGLQLIWVLYLITDYRSLAT